jgi:hypothetical protein
MEATTMVLARWYSALLALWGNPWVRGVGLTLYYLAILAGLLILYGKRHFQTPPFVYQGF